MRFFASNGQLRGKYHHVPDLDSPIPKTLASSELARLSNPNLYKKRLKTFRNRKILPDAYIEAYARRVRLHILNPSTKMIKGTLGANREKNNGTPKTKGYHFYNDKTGFNGFFNKNEKRYRIGFTANTGQKNDIDTNNNMM